MSVVQYLVISNCWPSSRREKRAQEMELCRWVWLNPKMIFYWRIGMEQFSAHKTPHTTTTYILCNWRLDLTIQMYCHKLDLQRKSTWNMSMPKQERWIVVQILAVFNLSGLCLKVDVEKMLKEVNQKWIRTFGMQKILMAIKSNMLKADRKTKQPAEGSTF